MPVFTVFLTLDCISCPETVCQELLLKLHAELSKLLAGNGAPMGVGREPRVGTPDHSTGWEPRVGALEKSKRKEPREVEE